MAKVQLDLEYRESASAKMERWSMAREELEKYKDRAGELVKGQIRLRVWVCLIQQ